MCVWFLKVIKPCLRLVALTCLLIHKIFMLVYGSVSVLSQPSERSSLFLYERTQSIQVKRLQYFIDYRWPGLSHRQKPGTWRLWRCKKHVCCLWQEASSSPTVPCQVQGLGLSNACKSYRHDLFLLNSVPSCHLQLLLEVSLESVWPCQYCQWSSGYHLLTLRPKAWSQSTDYKKGLAHT